MIPIQELRVGGLFMSAKWQIPVTCTLEDFYNLCANCEGATSYPPIDDMFEPIVITAELLRRLGFKMERMNSGPDPDYSITNGRKVLEVRHGQDEDWLVFFQYDIGMEWCEVAFNPPIHLLMNIYYDLFNEELKIQ